MVDSFLGKIVLWYSVVGGGSLAGAGYAIAIGTGYTVGGVGAVLLFGGGLVSALAFMGAEMGSGTASGAIEPGTGEMMAESSSRLGPPRTGSALQAFFVGIGCVGYGTVLVVASL